MLKLVVFPCQPVGEQLLNVFVLYNRVGRNITAYEEDNLERNCLMLGQSSNMKADNRDAQSDNKKTNIANACT